MENLANDVETTLAAAITTAGQTAITVASNAGFPSANFRVRIGDELLLVTANPSTSWTVQRGVEGTTATTHSAGAAVTHVLTKEGLDIYVGTAGVAHAWERIPAGRVVVVLADRQMAVRGGTLRVQGTLKTRGSTYVT